MFCCPFGEAMQMKKGCGKERLDFVWITDDLTIANSIIGRTRYEIKIVS